MPTLWQRIKSKFRPAKAPDEAVGSGEADAKKRLDDIRENELSLGAAMRRGEGAKVAPAQPSRPMSSWDKIGTARSHAAGTRSASRTSGSSSTSTNASASDFVIGLAVGASMADCETGSSGGTDTDCSGSGD